MPAGTAVIMPQQRTEPAKKMVSEEFIMHWKEIVLTGKRGRGVMRKDKLYRTDTPIRLQEEGTV
jgi:hypothetical protein